MRVCVYVCVCVCVCAGARIFIMFMRFLIIIKLAYSAGKACINLRSRRPDVFSSFNY